MKTLKVLVFAVLVFVVAKSCFGEGETGGEYASPESLFSRGNDYYEKGEYGSAIDEYEKVLAGGYESGPVYYNLGNAYFKTGELGKAILNYDRARRIMPRDADLNANYRFARAKIKGRVYSGRRMWFRRFLDKYYGSFSMDELIWLSSGVYIIILILGFIAVFRPGIKRYTLAAIVLFFVFISLNIVVIWREAGLAGREVIVTEPETEVRFGPFDSATKFFSLYEGMSAVVVGSKDNWYKVKRPDGKVGWIMKADVEAI